MRFDVVEYGGDFVSVRPQPANGEFIGLDKAGWNIIIQWINQAEGRIEFFGPAHLGELTKHVGFNEAVHMSYGFWVAFALIDLAKRDTGKKAEFTELYTWLVDSIRIAAKSHVIEMVGYASRLRVKANEVMVGCEADPFNLEFLEFSLRKLHEAQEGMEN